MLTEGNKALEGNMLQTPLKQVCVFCKQIYRAVVTEDGNVLNSAASHHLPRMHVCVPSAGTCRGFVQGS